MERFCFGVFAAVLLATLLPHLPDLQFMVLITALAIISGYCRAYFCLGFLLFLLSLSLQVHWHQHKVSYLLARTNTEFEGRIASIAQQYGDSYFFLLEVESKQSAFALAQTELVAVRWFDATERPLAGQRWRFNLTLKPVRGVANPGSGNKEAAALVHAVLAQGTVKRFLRLDDNRSWRQQAYDLIQTSTLNYPSQPILLALSVGERPFSPELWLALQSSGLSHLISISGMHIALVFGWVLLAKPALQFLPLPQIWRERLLWSLALTAAIGYCILAGFAIPTWRALVAIVVITLLRMLLRRTSGWRFSLVFTCMMLVCWPTLMLSVSFWLSVSAVALLFFMQWRFATPQSWLDRFRQFVLFQWLFTLMLLPVSLLFFHGIAPLGFLCNLLFVPWISVLGIPALLLVFVLQLLWPLPLEHLWLLVDWVFRPLIWLFEHLAIADHWWSLPEPSTPALLFMLVAMIIYGLGRSRLTLSVALMLSLASVLQWQQPPMNTLHLVDVGQGTALVLQQGRRALIYDVGPRYGDYSATKSHLLPYLRYLGIQQLDYLMLSHNDSDHTGDWRLLQQAYPKLTLVTDISDVGEKLSCQQLPRYWGAFKLQVLWSQQTAKSMLQAIPAAKLEQPKNHDSCVVLLTSYTNKQQWQVLLTGDADIAAERQILARYPDLRADVLLLGHHGSKTSSDLTFLQALQVKTALNSAGFHNPYSHPATDVKARLQLLNIPLFNTAELGAIRMQFTDERLIFAFWRQQPWLAWLENVADNAESIDSTR